MNAQADATYVHASGENIIEICGFSIINRLKGAKHQPYAISLVFVCVTEPDEPFL